MFQSFYSFKSSLLCIFIIKKCTCIYLHIYIMYTSKYLCMYRSSGFEAETDSDTPPESQIMTSPLTDSNGMVNIHGQHINQSKDQFLEQEKGIYV
jgi:hypothetical protein